LAEIVPTCPISSSDLTFLLRALRSSITAPTARSMPRLRSIGFMPAATALHPSRTIAWARMVAVVVPSPASSLVREATSRTICAPMFSNLSSSVISLATVTPSLVMRGAPNDLSITTLRPLGPSVTFTASARTSMPRSILFRASVLNLTSFAAIGPGSLFDNAHDVGFLHDQVILAVDLDFGSRPFAVKHAIALLDIEGYEVAVLVARAGPGRDDLALLRLFLRGVGDDHAARGLGLGREGLDENTVV